MRNNWRGQQIWIVEQVIQDENARKHISETERGKTSEKAKNISEKQKERKWEKGAGKRKKKLFLKYF